MPPYSPNPIPSFAHSLGGWGEPGLARRVPSNDTHYTGVWQLRGRREPPGLCSHGTRPAHPGPFLILYESGAQGRRAGRGEELARGQLEPGERKEHWGVWVPRVGVEAGGAGVARCVRVCMHIRAGVFRPTGSLCINTGILPAHPCGGERVYAGEALAAPRMGSASPTSLSLVHLTCTDGWVPACAR